MKIVLFNTVQYKTWRVLFVMLFYMIDALAQIVYTDIEPDYVIQDLEDSYQLDLNNDGINDFSIFNFEIVNNGFPPARISDDNNGVNAVTVIYNYEAFIIPLEEDTVIYSDESSNSYPFSVYGYLDTSDCTDLPSWCFMTWNGKTNKYIGLRFLITGQTHYGWARLDFINGQWIVKDYAYNATPNEPIQTGQKALSIEDFNLQQVKVMVSNRQISILNLTDRASFNLYSINGQKIRYGNLEQNSGNINMLDLHSGLYILELINNQSKAFTIKKFIIP